MRIWRIVVTFVALIFIFKVKYFMLDSCLNCGYHNLLNFQRRKTLLRFWLIIYFWTLFTSLCIFVYVLADYLYPPPIQVVVTCLMFCGDNCIRFAVVFFVLRTTIQPPAVTPTSDLSPAGRGSHLIAKKPTPVFRSHSLRSQTGSTRVKRSSLSMSTRKSRKLRRLPDPELDII